jgi:hypothetical protein
VFCLGVPVVGPALFGSVEPAAFSRAAPEPPACPGPPGPPVPALVGPSGVLDPGAGGMAGAGVGQPFAPQEPVEPPDWPGVLRTGVARTDRLQPGPPAPQTEASAVLAVGWAGFAGPVTGGLVELSVTGSVFGALPHGVLVGPHPVVCGVAAALALGVAGLGAPPAGGVAAVAAAAGWAGLGAPVPAGVAVVSVAGLA